MLPFLKILPLVLDSCICMELRITLGVPVSVLDIIGDKLGHYQGVDPLVLVFRLDRYQQQVNRVSMPGPRLEQMIPPHREKSSTALLKRNREGWH